MGLFACPEAATTAVTVIALKRRRDRMKRLVYARPSQPFEVHLITLDDGGILDLRRADSSVDDIHLQHNFDVLMDPVRP